MLDDTDFKIVEKCPWCSNDDSILEYIGSYESIVKRCNCCGIVYSKKILNKYGRKKYWSNYESRVHNIQKDKVLKRKKMYELECEYIIPFIGGVKVLDVACSNGDFLDQFHAKGFDCYGVEFASEAAELARKKYIVFGGDDITEFPDLAINEKFDLIIFRGSIQYFVNPKKYFEKAIDLLNENGIIYITSSPNADSFCFKLFKDKFRLPVGPTDYFAFSEKLLTQYFMDLNLALVGHTFFYEETPYANVDDDLCKVKKALQALNKGEKIDFLSPPFYDNMLTLVYKKV